MARSHQESGVPVIALIQWGDKFSDEYVFRLEEGIHYNTTIPYHLTVLRDADLVEEGWWNKLYLFHLFRYGRTIFMDLDTVITGNIDSLLAWDGNFAIMRGFGSTKFGSGVMSWKGDHSYIWDEFVRRGNPRVGDGDQGFLAEVLVNYKLIQDVMPDLVCSYKIHVLKGKPITPIVCFHGKPMPHEVGWKVE